MVETPIFELIVLVVVVAAISVVYWLSKRQPLEQLSDNHYIEALEHLVDGKERLAIQKFKDAVHADTENHAAYLRLGDVLRKRNLSTNAIRIHKDLTLRSGLDASMRAKIMLSLFNDYVMLNDTTNAIATARQLLQTGEQPEPDFLHTLLSLLEREARWKEALELVRQYRSAFSPKDLELEALYTVFQGLELQDADKHKDARVKFKEAIKKNKDCAAAHYYLGKSYVNEQRLEDAADIWTRFCKSNPEVAHLIFPELEKVWYELGRFFDAENLYQDLFERDKNSLTAGLALAEIYHKKGAHDTALDIIKQLEEYHPDASPLIEKKAFYHFEKGLYKEAATLAMSVYNHGNSLRAQRYRCRNCKQEIKTPQWICPKCQHVDTFNF